MVRSGNVDLGVAPGTNRSRIEATTQKKSSRGRNVVDGPRGFGSEVGGKDGVRGKRGR